jgi:hypothetical protein
MQITRNRKVFCVNLPGCSASAVWSHLKASPAVSIVLGLLSWGRWSVFADGGDHQVEKGIIAEKKISSIVESSLARPPTVICLYVWAPMLLILRSVCSMHLPSKTKDRNPDSYFTGGISRSLQIFFARKSLISTCRGIVEHFLTVRFIYTVCLPPSRRNMHPFFSMWRSKSFRFIKLRPRRIHG